MTGLPIRLGAWALGIVVVLTGCASRPMLPDVDTSALLLEPYPGLEPVIVAAPQLEALRAPVALEREAEPAPAPAPCALPPAAAAYTAAIRAPVRASAPSGDVRSLFGVRAALDDACPGGT